MNVHVPPVRLSKVVDATGAGDAFLGGLIAGMRDVFFVVLSALHSLYVDNMINVEKYFFLFVH